MLNNSVKLPIHLVDRVASYTAVFKVVKDYVGDAALNGRGIWQ